MREENDLSEYEVKRLQNIKRNEAFLQQLGLVTPSISGNQNKKQSTRNPEDEEIKKRKRKEQVLQREILLPTRKSPRLHSDSSPGADVKVKAESIDKSDKGEEEEDVNYDRMPQEPFQLDDTEFQIFVELKKWRLKRCRELQIEPYAVFQNRSLCEFIRRKRNNEKWALPIAQDLQNNEEEITRLKKELLECWGIGPSKAKPDRFGFEVNSVFHQLNVNLLLQLRSSSNEAKQAKEEA